MFYEINQTNPESWQAFPGKLFTNYPDYPIIFPPQHAWPTTRRHDSESAYSLTNEQMQRLVVATYRIWQRAHDHSAAGEEDYGELLLFQARNRARWIALKREKAMERGNHLSVCVTWK